MTTKKPTKRGASGHVAVRFDARTLARLEALRPSLSTEWREAPLSDALRAAILTGLGVLEKARPIAKARLARAADTAVAALDVLIEELEAPETPSGDAS